MDVGFTFPVSELYCAIPSVDLSRVLVSHSPGGFVCNNINDQQQQKEKYNERVFFTHRLVSRNPKVQFIDRPVYADAFDLDFAILYKNSGEKSAPFGQTMTLRSG